jgi:N-acetylglutamate synthase-like GNAT family acetyltransferase
MRLRPGSAGDLATVQALEKAARVRYLGMPELAFAAAAPPIAADRLRDGELILADEDGRIIGFVLLGLIDTRLYVANISVAPDASGCGVGAVLMAEAEQRAAARGLGAVTLTTFRAPPWNAPWFGRLGFIEMPAALIGPELRAILARQATFLDPATRTTLWRPLPG